jgi:hypothetical protein
MNFLKYNDWEKYDCKSINYVNYDLKNKNKKNEKSTIQAIHNDKLSYINIYNGTKQIKLTTPPMKCLFGLVNNYENSYQINLQFTNYKTDDTMNRFYKFIQNIELHQIKHIGLSEENLELYLSQIQKKEKYDPNLIVKVPFRYNKFEVECKNNMGEEVYLTKLPKFHMVRCDIYIDKIWKFNDSYVCKWKLNKLQLL